jgi:hypothetical protein
MQSTVLQDQYFVCSFKKLKINSFKTFLGNPDYLDMNVLCPSTTTGSATGVERKYYDETNSYYSNLSFNQ